MSARAAQLLRRTLALLLCLLLVFTLTACTSEEISSAISVAGNIVSALTDGDSSEESGGESGGESYTADTGDLLDPDGSYDDRDSVALYLHQYGCLPKNFMTKSEAHKLGWDGGSLEEYAPGMCIGGDRFGNYEKLLPTDRNYHECDINTLGASKRGAERIIYSDDGLIYYTNDHYESFTLLYGEE